MKSVFKLTFWVIISLLALSDYRWLIGYLCFTLFYFVVKPIFKERKVKLENELIEHSKASKEIEIPYNSQLVSAFIRQALDVWVKDEDHKKSSYDIIERELSYTHRICVMITELVKHIEAGGFVLWNYNNNNRITIELITFLSKYDIYSFNEVKKILQEYLKELEKPDFQSFNELTNLDSKFHKIRNQFLKDFDMWLISTGEQNGKNSNKGNENQST